MEFFEQIWHGVLAPHSGCGPICQPWQDFMQQGWDLIPAKGETADKLSLLFNIIGGLGGLSFFYWLWQKWKKTDIDSQVGAVKSDVAAVKSGLEELKELLAQKDASWPGRDQPGSGPVMGEASCQVPIADHQLLRP